MMVCLSDDEMRFYIERMKSENALLSTFERMHIEAVDEHMHICESCRKRRDELAAIIDAENWGPKILLALEDLEDFFPPVDEEEATAEEHGYYPDDRDQT